MRIVSCLVGAAALCASAAALAQQSPQSQPTTQSSPAGAGSGAESSAGGAAGQQTTEASPEQKQMAGMVLSKMHMTNQMEMKVGKLAMKKGATDEVRRYGDRLVRDHRFADGKVENMAKAKGITLQTPEPQDEAAKKHMQKEQEMAQKLEGMSGREFDRMFLQMMVMGHENAIGMLTQAHAQTNDADLKDMLGKMIPILKQHETVARMLESSAGSQAAG
jgi:putative membrane protein